MRPNRGANHFQCVLRVLEETCLYLYSVLGMYWSSFIYICDYRLISWGPKYVDVIFLSSLQYQYLIVISRFLIKIMIWTNLILFKWNAFQHLRLMQYYRIHASIVPGGEQCCPVLWLWYGIPFLTENTQDTWNGISYFTYSWREFGMWHQRPAGWRHRRTTWCRAPLCCRDLGATGYVALIIQ